MAAEWFELLGGNGSSIALLVTVAVLWGVTNPLMRKGGEGIEAAGGSWFGELYFLATTWKYLLPFLANQLGSVLFLFALQSSELSLAVPLTNALTFVFTALVGHLLGEETGGGISHHVGMAMVVLGVSLCVVSKSGVEVTTNEDH